MCAETLHALYVYQVGADSADTQTDQHTHTVIDATDHPTHASATDSVVMRRK